MAFSPGPVLAPTSDEPVPAFAARTTPPDVEPETANNDPVVAVEDKEVLPAPDEFDCPRISGSPAAPYAAPADSTTTAKAAVITVRAPWRMCLPLS
jgi:hypothetical protein